MKHKIQISAACSRFLSCEWSIAEIRKVIRFFERKQGCQMPRLRLYIKKVRRGHGYSDGSATIPIWALSGDKAKTFGVWYIIHELLHVYGYSHGDRMLKREQELMAYYGVQLCYGPNSDYYPVRQRNRNGNILCDEYGRHAAWFFEI